MLNLIVICILICAASTYTLKQNILSKRGFVIPVQTPSKLSNVHRLGAGISLKSKGISDMKSRLDMVTRDSKLTIQPSFKRLPQHASIVQGKLENGFSYMILPNSNPPERFEAHLEVLSGSVNELDHQQGMAHLLEHVCYMGSPKRQLIAGTGSKTNAYTDFHHTVFFASCPTNTPDAFWKRPMLPMALDALVDVMTCQVGGERLEKERAAVLSEASMVNKVEYRVECQLLSALHGDNRIPSRFPIGKESQIKSWTADDLQAYHDTHYRPDNAVLYVVGDVQPDSAVETIRQKFSHLKAKSDFAKVLFDSGEFPTPLHSTMWGVNRHFPPVTHNWSSRSQNSSRCKLSNSLPYSNSNSAQLEESTVAAPAPPKVDARGSLPTPRVFSHELLQSFSFHLFTKRPIEPITSDAALKRELMRRIALTALQIRLNVQQRQAPLFTSVDFNQMNWPREGCAVCSLDLTTDVASWREAVVSAVKETRRLGLHGLTTAELARYKQGQLAEACQAAMQAGDAINEEVIQSIMDHEASGHTYMDPQHKYETVQSLLLGMSLSEVNDMARELCEHVSHIDPEIGITPTAIVACTPTADRNGQPCVVSETDIASAVQEALIAPIKPLEDTPIPDTLITAEQLRIKMAENNPVWVPLEGNALKSKTESGGERKAAALLGVVQKRLGNGLRVNLKPLSTEAQKASVRIYIPGGRMLEPPSAVGSIELAARTIQEGGAFLNVTREQVELFCIDHMVQVEVAAMDDHMAIDLSTVTTRGPGGLVNGLEAALQVVHVLLTDFKYEEDAFRRAKQALHEKYDASVKGLESACERQLTDSMTGRDSRFTDPTHSQLGALTLSAVERVAKSQLDPRRVEVSISGDVPLSELEDLALKYLGSVPKPTTPLLRDTVSSVNPAKGPSGTGQDHPYKNQLSVFLPDSDERAIGYLTGAAPNGWGIFADGKTVAEKLRDKNNGRDAAAHRTRPLFSRVVLQIFEEVANRRLFSVVREERQLTYDASFQLESHESLQGGWYTVSVTSNPSQVHEALIACKEALRSLRGPHGVSADTVHGAKRALRNKRVEEINTNKFWAEALSGTQSDSVPLKTVQSIGEYDSVLNSVTARDIHDLVDLLGFKDDHITSCVGITAPQRPLPSTVMQP